MTLQETQLVLREGLTISGKPLREHFEITNHAKAIYFIEQLVYKNKPMNASNLLELHQLILDDIDQQWAGRFRNAQVRIASSLHVPPNAIKVPELMKQVHQLLSKKRITEHPIAHAAHIHHQFVHIHPFFDGNGRTARLLMNFALMQQGYPPATILKNDRYKYYDALERAHRGDMQKFLLIIGQAVERSLDLYLEAAIATTKSNEYKLLRDLAKELDISQEYLSLLARQGKIDAFKQSRNWVSSCDAVEAYMKGRKRVRE